MELNTQQVKGIAERIATLAVLYGVSKGYVPEAVAPDLVAAVLMAGSVAYGYKINRKKELIVAAKT